MKDFNDMTLDRLHEELTDNINERESFPENSRAKRAAELDDEYGELDGCIWRLEKLVEGIKSYVMEDTVRKENFSDIEICCEEDNLFANEEIENILDEYTLNNCVEFLSKEEVTAEEILNRLHCSKAEIENIQEFVDGIAANTKEKDER